MRSWIILRIFPINRQFLSYLVHKQVTIRLQHVQKYHQLLIFHKIKLKLVRKTVETIHLCFVMRVFTAIAQCFDDSICIDERLIKLL